MAANGMQDKEQRFLDEDDDVASIAMQSTTWKSTLRKWAARFHLTPSRNEDCGKPENRLVLFGAYAGLRPPVPETRYCTNGVQTAKYTIWTFLPRNLSEQFSKVANCFFLGIIVLQLIPETATTGPLTAAIPLIAIVAMTALKDAVEDWRRRKSDQEVNGMIALVLEGGRWSNQHCGPQMDLSLVASVHRRLRFPWKGSESAPAQFGAPRTSPDESTPDATMTNTDAAAHWKPTVWASVRVGDIVCLRGDQVIPADMVLLAASGMHSIAYVETKSLDGETNLKLRMGFPEFSYMAEEMTSLGPERQSEVAARLAGHCSDLAFDIECERPTAALYSFHGAIAVLRGGDTLPDDSVGKVASTTDTVPPLLDTLTHQPDCLGLTPSVSRGTALTDGLSVPLSPTDMGNANLDPDEDEYPLQQPVLIDNILLRGCLLRNTDWAIGAVIATGNDTKLRLNTGKTPSKRSKIDQKLNPFSLFNFGIMFCLVATCTAMFGAVGRQPNTFGYLSRAQFIRGDGAARLLGEQLVATFFAYLVVFQNIVPISMFITIEIVKSAQAFFIHGDQHLCHDGKPCIPRTWNIADDLGATRYIFSDKTGTLTQNIMEFKRCWIAGEIYGDRDLKQNPSDIAAFKSLQQQLHPPKGAPQNRYMSPSPSFADPRMLRDFESPPAPEWTTAARHFWLLLATCHTVLAEVSPTSTDNTTMSVKYKAQSPDEGALVAAARDVGFVFLGRQQAHIHLCIRGVQMTAELLHIVEFDSDRKRMSVVVLLPDGRRVLFVKGADSALLPRLAESQADAVAKSTGALDEFANQGLRTLVLAWRELHMSEYAEIAQRFEKASTMIDGREEAVAGIGEDMERNLVLLGVTAIEDKLQVGVPEAIHALSRAGIHMWVLTGDKVETAVQVGYACNLITTGMNLVMVRGSEEGILSQLEAATHQIRQFERDSGEPSVLVVDGEALALALQRQTHRKLFLALCLKCYHVLCCRVSPLQKAQVVGLVRQALSVVTLAIGDGANDVSMIQEANIGVGIAGEEGAQAAMSADFAIGQFRFLVPLILVHGRWARLRVSSTIQTFLFKNITWVLAIGCYQIFNGFSAAIPYDYIFPALFNAILVQLPSLSLGTLDRDLSYKTLMANPEAYRVQRSPFSWRNFLTHVAQAIYIACVSFFFMYGAYSNGVVNPKGHVTFQHETTIAVVFSATASINIYIGLQHHALHTVTFAGILVSTVAPVALAMLMGLASNSPMRSIERLVYIEPALWLTAILSAVAALLPSIVIKYMYATFWPDHVQILRELEALPPPPQSVPAAQAVASASTAETLPISGTSLANHPERVLRDQPVLEDAPPAVPIAPPVSLSKKRHARAKSLVVDTRRNKSVSNPPQRPLASVPHRSSVLFYDASRRETVPHSGFAFDQTPGMSASIVTISSPTAAMYQQQTLARRRSDAAAHSHQSLVNASRKRLDGSSVSLRTGSAALAAAVDHKRAGSQHQSSSLHHSQPQQHLRWRPTESPKADISSAEAWKTSTLPRKLEEAENEAPAASVLGDPAVARTYQPGQGSGAMGPLPLSSRQSRTQSGSGRAAGLAFSPRFQNCDSVGSDTSGPPDAILEESSRGDEEAREDEREG
ncbi:hypothetical protein BC828DRAFT_388015 [Blastocladiella britannica]|nr:hypothetical protein BC828DRAFT_388015 [Blastocladiella britannica]